MMNKNTFLSGIIAGAVAPFLSFLVFYGIIYLLVLIFGMQAFLPLNSLIMLSIAPNFLLLRYFHNRKKLEHTGQGVLFVTVGCVLLFFIFIHGRSLPHLPGLQW